MPFKFNPFTGNFDLVNPEKFENIYLKQASEDISALKIVRAISDTQIAIADNDTYTKSKAFGVALTASTTGGNVRVQTFGEIKDASFLFPINEPLFLGSNGVITITPPILGFVINIGYSLGNGAIFIDINEQIELP